MKNFMKEGIFCMFFSDKPITNKSGDCLNRTVFSKQLARAILSYTKTDNFTISLCGKWGCGKTSIINMVVDEIQTVTESYDIDEKPIIIMFNPWNYSDCTQLIDQFFQTIIDELSINDSNGKLRVVGDALQKYSSVFHYTSYIPVIGQYLSPIVELLTAAGQHIVEKADNNETLAKQKDVVIKALREQKRKFVIIIDDIDRLNNEQIRLIFQLVNSLAGFPNMIYLLSFDKGVVCRALAEEQNCKGEEYLEKIIQVPFDVPETNKKLVREVFCKRVEEIINKDNGDEVNFDTEYWQVIFPECIAPFLVTMRDVNRILNVFEFKYGLLKQEVNLIDLLTLTTLQICAQPIFNWIYLNMNSITGSMFSTSGITGAEQSANEKKYLELFEDIYPDSPELMLKIIQLLFPKMCWNTGGYSYGNDSDAELSFKQRVAARDRATRYFNLSMEEIIFDKKKMLSIVNNFGEQELSDYLADLMEKQMLYDFLRELTAYIKAIPQERCLLFANELLKLRNMTTKKERIGSLSPSASYECFRCLYQIFKRNLPIENLRIICYLIHNCEIDQVSYLCEIIECIEGAYGRMGMRGDTNWQIIEESQLVQIEAEIMKRIRMISEQYCLLDCGNMSSVYYVWKNIDRESFDEYIKKQIKEPLNIPKILLIISNKWTGSYGHGWSFDEKALEEYYLSSPKVYDIVSSLKQTKAFCELKTSFKEMAIAFSIWYHKEKTEFTKVTKDEVDAIMPEWVLINE